MSVEAWQPASALVPPSAHGWLAASGLTAGAVTGALLFVMEGRRGKTPPLVLSAAFAAVSSAAWAVGIVCLCLWLGIFL